MCCLLNPHFWRNLNSKITSKGLLILHNSVLFVYLFFNFLFCTFVFESSFYQGLFQIPVTFRTSFRKKNIFENQHLKNEIFLMRFRIPFLDAAGIMSFVIYLLNKLVSDFY